VANFFIFSLSCEASTARITHGSFISCHPVRQRQYLHHLLRRQNETPPLTQFLNNDKVNGLHVVVLTQRALFVPCVVIA
jgi:hypothetical protein